MKHLRLLIIFIALLIAPCLSAETEGTSLEYRVKAVVLFNFAKYVRWPANAFQAADQPIRVCILGESPFGDVFESNDAPKEAQGRPLTVVNLPRSATQNDAVSCQILFWQEKNDSVAKALLPALEKSATLTVADRESEQALISFTLEDGKVRFRIRRKAAEALGLNISSQLLKLAILDE